MRAPFEVEAAHACARGMRCGVWDVSIPRLPRRHGLSMQYRSERRPVGVTLAPDSHVIMTAAMIAQLTVLSGTGDASTRSTDRKQSVANGLSGYINCLSFEMVTRLSSVRRHRLRD
jgi:hypothetical protein